MKSKKASIKIDPETFENDDNVVHGKFKSKQRKSWGISPTVRIHEEKNRKKKERQERKNLSRKALKEDIERDSNAE